ncbi:MAG: hypothetical protein OXG35_22305 [Acidobacteria bacterium]|nr:hypothetical protein [Acidobacteriota bacterium]
MPWEIERTGYVVRTEEDGITGDEHDTVEKAAAHCNKRGSTVVEYHHGVKEGAVVHRYTEPDRPSWTQYDSVIAAADHRDVTVDELILSADKTGLTIVEIEPHGDVLVPDKLTGRETRSETADAA